MEHLGWGRSKGKFSKQLSIFEKLSNSESRGKKLGKAGIYDGSVIPTTPNSNRVPGSRPTYDRPKGKGKSEGKSNFRNGKGPVALKKSEKVMKEIINLNKKKKGEPN